MKKVIIIGANGNTSKEIIPRILEQKNIHLTLFSRHPERVNFVENDRIKIFKGDATNFSDLKNAIRGQDIVISTMGGMDLDIKTKNIITVMKDESVSRIIAISAGGIYDELPEPFNTWDKKMVGYTRPINLKMADVIEQSQLVYTVLRPVWLTNKQNEEYELTRKGDVFKGTETSRASLGHFIANIVENNHLYINENLGISQPNTDGEKPKAYS